jgi:hypothetical protein
MSKRKSKDKYMTNEELERILKRSRELGLLDSKWYLM